MANDEEYARQVCDLEDAGQGTPPGASSSTGEPEISTLGYTMLIARLDLIADRIMGVRTAVQSSFSRDHQEPRFEPLPRPTTAYDRERERRTIDELTEIADSFFMGADPPHDT